MNWLLIRGWNGEEELWKIVWVYGAFAVFLGKVAVVVLRLTSSVDLDNPVGTQVCFLDYLEAFYCVWILVALWRCAFNADWSIWGYFVRPLVVLFILLFFAFSSFDKKPIEPKELLIRTGTILQIQAKHWLKKL